MATRYCKQFRVSGRVQGVFFRRDAQNYARVLKLSGWIRNCNDGSIEMIACGEIHLLDAFADWLQDGPPAATVEKVESKDVLAQDFRDFEIRYN